MSVAWLNAQTCCDTLDGLASTQGAAWRTDCGDPHMLPDWFALLAETASPDDAQFALWSCGADTTLPVIRRQGEPHRVNALANFYTPLFGALGDRQGEAAGIQQLAKAVRAATPRTAEIRLAPMAPESPLFDKLQKGFQQGGWWVDRYLCFGNWYHLVEPGGYAKYFGDRPSQTRNTVNRSAKKLAKMPDYQLAIHTAPGEALEQAITAFVDVYNRSWKQPEPFPRFIPELCRRSAKAGWLRLGVIHVGNQPVAAQLWLVMKGKAHIVKLAYDQAFDKASAGSVLTAELMRHVIDIDLVSEIDYLIGDDPYKQSWMTVRRERWGLVAFNPLSLRGLAAAGRHFAGRLRARVRLRRG